MGVAQLVELLVVVQAVAGSSPVAHPSVACSRAGKARRFQLAGRPRHPARAAARRDQHAEGRRPGVAGYTPVQRTINTRRGFGLPDVGTEQPKARKLEARSGMAQGKTPSSTRSRSASSKKSSSAASKRTASKSKGSSAARKSSASKRASASRRSPQSRSQASKKSGAAASRAPTEWWGRCRRRRDR